MSDESDSGGCGCSVVTLILAVVVFGLCNTTDETNDAVRKEREANDARRQQCRAALATAKDIHDTAHAIASLCQ